MTGYRDFLKIFSPGRFIHSREVSQKFSLNKALVSLYIIPTFFRGVYYLPTIKEREGHFIEKPMDFFSSLFNFVYGRGNWYWSLSVAARYYAIEWSATKIIEIVTTKESKIIDIFSRASSLQKKRSYRSKIFSQILFSLDTNIVIIHKGKPAFLKEVKISPEIGAIATEERLKKDIEFFMPKSRMKQLRNLYKRLAK